MLKEKSVTVKETNISLSFWRNLLDVFTDFYICGRESRIILNGT